MHTDDTRLVCPQHLACAQRLGDVGARRAARQHQPAAHELGDAAKPDDESGGHVATGFRGAESERAVDESQRHDDPVDRYEQDEGEDALTG